MENQFNNIYKDKTVLVTGHTGFKGSWLTLWLSKLGATVVGYSKDIPSNPSHFELLKLNVISIVGDILDKEKLTETILTYKPDIVFHMAAQPLVRLSYKNPVETFETNIMGTINVLEACRQAGTVKAIVNVTSDKCYQNNETGKPFQEDDPMGGDDPYSASKGAVEIVSNSYRKSFFKPEEYGISHSTLIANVRAGNVIGGGDWAHDRLIPDIMRATSKGEKVTIRKPHATRPWQHVLEPLSGYLQVGAHLLEGKKEFADNWNFGPSDSFHLPVHEVINHTKKHWDKIDFEIQEDPNGLHEAKLLALDSSKARNKLKWKNVWDHHATFEKTVHWYKVYYTDAILISEQDLAAYIEDAKKSAAVWIIQ
jgi:CDP-glucose 4,6-dehydratase